MTSFNSAASLLPLRLCGELLVLPEEIRNTAEEIRLRAGQAISLNMGDTERVFVPDYTVSTEDLQTVLEKATGASVHAVESSLSAGYIAVRGGIRIGLCGSAVMKGERLCGVRRLSSVSIRIPHEPERCAAREAECLKELGFPSTLIISPPGYGKTTCMRSLIRYASDCGYRISVADERGELAAVWDGQAQFEVGSHTDVFSSAPKAEAATLLLRAMNPDILAMDEISAADDVRAICEAAGCGVRVFATAHARDVADMLRRPIYREMINERIFSYALIIGKSGTRRSYSLEALEL